WVWGGGWPLRAHPPAPRVGGRTMTTMAPAIDLDALLRRLHLPTVRRLYPELAQRAETDSLGYRDFLAVLMAEEVAHRAQTRIQRCVRRAPFPFLKTIEEFDFTFQSSVRLALLGSVLGPELVTHGHCLIASGPSGTGKTHLAVAIAYRAIQNGFDARFTTATEHRRPLARDAERKTPPGAARFGVTMGRCSAVRASRVRAGQRGWREVGGLALTRGRIEASVVRLSTARFQWDCASGR